MKSELHSLEQLHTEHREAPNMNFRSDMYIKYAME